MGFHEVQFPDDIAYGSRGGPLVNTSILRLDSGDEERIARWAEPLRAYDVRYGIRDLSDLNTVIHFFVARLGPTNGFRFKDFFDFTTAADNRSASAFTDSAIGTGDGTTTTFQLKKTYTSGPTTQTRSITKPVSGTTTVGLGGVNQTSGWSVNTTNGIVTFTTAPGLGVAVTAGCSFDVPVRFGDSLATEPLMLAHDHFDGGSLPQIPLLEIRESTDNPEEFFYGGAKEHGAIGANTAITVGDGRIHIFGPTVAGRKCLLPDATALEPGGPYFGIYNEGSESLIIATSAAATLHTLAINSGVTVWLSSDNAATPTLTWYVF